jgi:phosphate-selective porin OprO and OprP
MDSLGNHVRTPSRPCRPGGRPNLRALFTSLLLVAPVICRAQGTAAPALLDSTIAAGESDAQTPVQRGLAKYNHWDLGFTTFRIGYGFLVDFATYAQDDKSKQQVSPEADIGLRDFRFMFKGKFKTERPFSWTAGIMYDGGTKDWHFRQTGIMFDVPEISSSFFIGRTKEGYSQYKYMVGYDIWTVERSPFLDAFIPIMADGVKWIVHVPRRHLLANVGWFNDGLSEDEKFATYNQQFVARLAWLPIVTERGKLIHVALMGREVEPDNHKFNARSKPEAYLAPYYVETGSFPTDRAGTMGLEAYYRDGSWLYGGEYGWQKFDAPANGDPMFHGGNVSVAWLITGETRGYNLVSGYFKGVSPKRTVFEGGPGAVEATLNLSYVDLEGGNLRGGKFWRLTPTVKWHLMDYLRVELAYGYGVLDRFDRQGTTHFFQGRVLTGL